MSLIHSYHRIYESLLLGGKLKIYFIAMDVHVVYNASLRIHNACKNDRKGTNNDSLVH